MNNPPHPAAGLAMWSTWQDKVRASLPNFCTHPIYVDQGQCEAEFQSVADYVHKRGYIDEGGQLRDAAFGARVVETTYGKLTRMWLDSNVELDFVLRHLGNGRKVLDIGAGYGRLAVAGRDLFPRYVCVDAVPVSTEVCRGYCAQFASHVEVPSFPDFLALYRHHYKDLDVAFNVHSWNECSLEQINGWLDLLGEMGVPYLFTVSHGQNDASIEGSYYTWDHGRPSFRPALESRYEIVAEESIGFSKHPHGLWRRK